MQWSCLPCGQLERETSDEAVVPTQVTDDGAHLLQPWICGGQDEREGGGQERQAMHHRDLAPKLRVIE